MAVNRTALLYFFPHFLFVCFFFLLFFSFRFRLNNIHMQNEFFKQIPHMAQVTLPTNYLDWKSKQLSVPLKSATNSLGRRDRSFAADEPHYVLVRSDNTNPRHMGITHHFFIWFLSALTLCRNHVFSEIRTHLSLNIIPILLFTIRNCV